MQAIEEVEEAKDFLAEEAYGRQIAVLNALKESLEKQKNVDAVFSKDGRYNKDEIELATGFFSDGNVIGEGRYGRFYKRNLIILPR